MQFEKKTRTGSLRGVIKLFIKIILIFLVLLVAIILIDRIDFPSPIKKLKK